MWTFLWECKSLIRTRDIDRSNLAAKSDLASLKAQVPKMDLNKLKRVPADLIKLSDVDGNDVIKKTVYDELVMKANTIVSKISSNR